MVRLLHTSDWQLGMTRRFLSKGVQERFSQARFDAIRSLGEVASKEECQCMVISGDMFDSNQVDRKTMLRAMEALKTVSVPVYILPGNHDPLNAASVYRSATLTESKPSHVHVIEDTRPITVSDSLEIVGAPWTSRRPVQDPVSEALTSLEPISGSIRVLVGHGAVDLLSPTPDAPGIISVNSVEQALRDRKLHYLALGDRHSVTRVGEGDGIWYSGAPEPTDYNEVKPGCALVVELSEELVNTTEIEIGHWCFIDRKGVDLNTAEDIEVLRSWLEEIEQKERTIVKLRLIGALSLLLQRQLEQVLSVGQELLAALQVQSENLIIVPDDNDFSDLKFTGFVSETIEDLRSTAEESGSDSLAARDALKLLVRLSGGLSDTSSSSIS